MEDLRHVLMVRELHILKFRSWSCCLHKFPCAGKVRSFSWLHCFQESEHWAFSCRFTWERSTSGFWVVCTRFLVLVWAPCPSSTFPGLTGYPKSYGRFSLVLHGLRKTKLTGLAVAWTVGFGSAIGEPSLELVSWPLFDMALCFSIGSERKLQKWLQENIEKLIMLNKRTRWFHSSRVKCALVSMSASWFLVSTYLIWIFGSELILSNNQSSATLWVLFRCWTSSFDNHLDDSFVVFKNVQLRLAFRRMCVGGYVIHICQLLNISLSPFGWCFGFVFIDGMVSCPAQVSLSWFTTSCSVVCWYWRLFLLHIQLMVINVRLPKIHKTPPEVDFWVLKVASKVWVLT